MADAAEDGSGDYLHISWRSPAIRGLQSDCRYVNNNEQITCRSHARALVRIAETELYTFGEVNGRATAHTESHR